MIQVTKITLEITQEASNTVGFENAEISVNPALLNLFDGDKPDYYFTIKTDDGFSFDDKNEIIELFTRIEKIAEASK